ncbi:MAG: hypothetical protein IJ274_00955 [Lachnospiraceae bacterium]|nr:hypothetical protein [Lachnospiraceae bacterium]
MKFTPDYYPLNAFRICADRIDDDVEGRVFSPLKPDVIRFSGMTGLLVKMDELFDRVGYPQAFQDKRSFDGIKEHTNLYRGIPEGEMSPALILEQTGEQKTFDVLVISRKNTSWQGELYNEDNAFLKSFNGEIELLESIVRFSAIE